MEAITRLWPELKSNGGTWNWLKNGMALRRETFDFVRTISLNLLEYSVLIKHKNNPPTPEAMVGKTAPKKLGLAGSSGLYISRGVGHAISVMCSDEQGRQCGLAASHGQVYRNQGEEATP